MELRKKLTQLAEEVKSASRILAELSSDKKRKVLNEVAVSFKRASRQIIKANQKDLLLARRMKLTDAMIDRLTLDSKRMGQMAKAVSDVAQLNDPIGQVLKSWRRPNGLRISKVTVPLGVILIIYESRPNVTSECASLCLKSGNAVLLRGGREALQTNRAIVRAYAEVFN